MLVRYAVAPLCLFTLACASERPALTHNDPHNAEAPTASVATSSALAARDGGDAHSHDAVSVGGVDEKAHVAHGNDDVAHGKAHEEHAGTDAGASAASADVYTCPMHPEIKQAKQGRCPKCGMKLEKTLAEPKEQVAVYTCPMHPEVQQDGPGRCPKCHMKLLPLKKQE